MSQETIILTPMSLWGVEMTTAEMWALIMSAHSMRETLRAIRAEADEALLSGRRLRMLAETQGAA